MQGMTTNRRKGGEMASDSKGEEKGRMEVEGGEDGEVGQRKGGWWRDRRLNGSVCVCERGMGKQGGGGEERVGQMPPL